MSYTFIQARNYTRANRTAMSREVIVNHTMESPEKPDTAENVARWFAGPTAPKASPHFCVDADSVVQCVRLEDVAWAAPGANHNGIQIEHAGTAKQTTREWSDPYSLAMLDASAQLQGRLVLADRIPVVWLDEDDLKAGRRGITGHVEVSRAFPRKSDHWDPGPNFPRRELLERIAFYRQNGSPARRKPPLDVFAGGRQIGRGYLVTPALIMRMSAALRKAGHAPPYTATAGGRVIASGQFWPPGEFTRLIRAAVDLGRTVVVDGTVTITKGKE